LCEEGELGHKKERKIEGITLRERLLWEGLERLSGKKKKQWQKRKKNKTTKQRNQL